MKKVAVTKITQWGNSLGLRIPKDVLYKAGFSKETPVEITLTEDQLIVIKRAAEIERVYSKEYFKKALKKEAFKGFKEYDWGKIAGKEIW